MKVIVNGDKIKVVSNDFDEKINDVSISPDDYETNDDEIQRYLKINTFGIRYHKANAIRRIE